MIPSGRRAPISKAVVDEIRARANPVEVIGQYVELKKSNRDFKGCCPFHGEKTGSFTVHSHGHYKCYGCGKQGDVFQFFQDLKGLDFPDAVRLVGEMVGVEVKEEVDPALERAMRAKAAVASTNSLAAAYWTARLQAPGPGAAGRAYLESRGINPETIAAFRLGVAAPSGVDLQERLRGRGVDSRALLTAGLLIEKEGGRPFERFRDRLMFPIFSPDGKNVVGFAGRALGPNASVKYLNTPETLLYKKSEVLYGFDRARESIRKHRSAVLVEGYFDTLAMHQAGFTNVVAVCGTALTARHVELLKKADCRDMTLFFDSDAGGVAGALRAASVLFPAGVAGRVAVLPAPAGVKVDPAAFLEKNAPDAMRQALETSRPLSTFILDKAVGKVCGEGRDPGTVEERLAVVRELIPAFKVMPPSVGRGAFEEAVAARVGMSGSLLSKALAEAGVAVAEAPRSEPALPVPEGEPKERIEEYLARVRAREAELVAGGPRPLVFPDRKVVQSLIVSEDASKPGRWRVTTLDASGTPTGHVEASGFEEGVRTARQLGADIFAPQADDPVQQARAKAEAGSIKEQARREMELDACLPAETWLPKAQELAAVRLDPKALLGGPLGTAGWIQAACQEMGGEAAGGLPGAEDAVWLCAGAYAGRAKVVVVGDRALDVMAYAQIQGRADVHYLACPVAQMENARLRKHLAGLVAGGATVVAAFADDRAGPEKVRALKAILPEGAGVERASPGVGRKWADRVAGDGRGMSR